MVSVWTPTRTDRPPTRRPGATDMPRYILKATRDRDAYIEGVIRKSLPIAVALYVAAIVAANALTAHYGLVPVGFGLLVTAGTYAAGLSLFMRDVVQRIAGQRWALIAMSLGIGLSWFLAAPAIALASAAAFGVAGVVDWAIYTRTRSSGFIRAAFISSVVAAPVDTVLFLAIAGFPLTAETVVGQFVGKVLWATIVPLVVFGGARALLRKSSNTAHP